MTIHIIIKISRLVGNFGGKMSCITLAMMLSSVVESRMHTCQWLMRARMQFLGSRICQVLRLAFCRAVPDSLVQCLHRIDR